MHERGCRIAVRGASYRLAVPCMSTADRLRATAAERFGWSALRPGQPEAMSALVDGHDELAVMPTGAGKSAVYQVPALLIDGPTIVVSPLISLQRDQIAGLAETAAPAAVAVNSAQRPSESLSGIRSRRCFTNDLAALHTLAGVSTEQRIVREAKRSSSFRPTTEPTRAVQRGSAQ